MVTGRCVSGRRLVPPAIGRLARGAKGMLADELRKTGDWLFRWRSYLPVALLGLFLSGMSGFQYPWQSHALDRVWEILCLTISFLGLGIRAYTVGHAPRGTSGRNTRRQLAAQLNTTGVYSIVRHPLYLGNFFIWLGAALFMRQWWVGVIFVLAFWLYYERIIFAEEAFLREKFGKAFADWADRTPAFFPRLRSWEKPALRLSGATVLKREYSGFFGIIAVFAFLEFVGDFVVDGRFEVDVMWAGILLTGLLVYLTLRALKKRARRPAATRPLGGAR